MNKFQYNPDCQWAQERIEAFLEGDLSPEETRQLEQHIAQCNACFEELEMARQVRATLQDIPGEICPDRVVEDVLSRIEREDSAPEASRGFAGIWRALLKGWMPAAAVLALVFAALFMLKAPPQHTMQKGDFPAKKVAPEKLARARHELEITFAYIGSVSSQSARRVYADVVEQGIAPPLEKALQRTIEKEPERIKKYRKFLQKFEI